MRRWTVRAGALLLGVLFVSPAGGDPTAHRDLSAFVAPYLRARDDNALGEVTGRAQGDPARPTLPSVPYEGVSVMLLPRSPDFESELAAIKDHLRDSLKTYIAATGEVADARASYERALIAVGGGELIRGEVSNAQGQVRLAGVPAGSWFLFAWREVRHPGKAPKLRPGDLAAARELPVSVGFSEITYWFLPVDVRASESTPIDLNDRNVWLTGIHDDVRIIEGQVPKITTPGTPTKRY